MIVAKKLQSKNKEKSTITQLNTIKQIYNRHFHMNNILQEISYDVVREQCTEVQTETLYGSKQCQYYIHLYSLVLSLFACLSFINRRG